MGRVFARSVSAVLVGAAVAAGAAGAASLVGCGGDDSSAPGEDSGTSDGSKHHAGDSGVESTGDGGSSVDGGDGGGGVSATGGAEDAGDSGSADAAPDAADGAPLAAVHLPFTSGNVNAIVHQGSSWYVGGNFDRVSRYRAGNLLSVDSTGAPTSCAIGEGFEDAVGPIVQAGNALYVGGNFFTYRNVTAPLLVKLDATTCALDTTFNPPGVVGFDNPVISLAVIGDSLYVGGGFNFYRGAPANYIAKLDTVTGALDTTFSPPGAANGFDNYVYSLAVIGSSLYAGGDFRAYRNVAQSATGLAKLDVVTGELDTTFTQPGGLGFDGSVSKLVVAGGSLYAGGSFTSYRGVPGAAAGVAKLDPTSGNVDTTFSPPNTMAAATSNGVQAGRNVFALAASDTSLYLGGDFGAYRGAPAAAIAKVDLVSGALDATFTPPGTPSFDVDGSETVYALAVSGGSVYVGGYFSAYRGVTGRAYDLAKLDAMSGVLDTTFGPPDSATGGVSAAYGGATVDSIFIGSSTVWVGGAFITYGGDVVHDLAKLDDTTYAVDTTFQPLLGPDVRTNVIALASTDDALYVGGDVLADQGVVPETNLLKVSLSTGAPDSAFSPAPGNSFDGSVLSLLVADRALFVGGGFDTYRNGSLVAKGLAKIDLSTGALDTVFNSQDSATGNGTDSAVHALAAAGTSIYLGGSFTTYRGVVGSASAIAKVDAVSGELDTTFSPPGANGFPVYPFSAPVIDTLAASGTSLYVGGGFAEYRGVAGSASNLAKLDLTTGDLDTTFSPPGASANGFDATVSGLAISGSGLFAGGKFTAYRGAAGSTPGLARLDPTTGALDTMFETAAIASGVFDVYGVVPSALAATATTVFASVAGAPQLPQPLIAFDSVTGTVR